MFNILGQFVMLLSIIAHNECCRSFLGLLIPWCPCSLALFHIDLTWFAIHMIKYSVDAIRSQRYLLDLYSSPYVHTLLWSSFVQRSWISISFLPKLNYRSPSRCTTTIK
ncbi:hypothetical protein BS17DRAFT_547752 [Gyrodon lividus]|nr:hypothetical protein BS17DRAFT_547752 [Gyrodon lividus]